MAAEQKHQPDAATHQQPHATTDPISPTQGNQAHEIEEKAIERDAYPLEAEEKTVSAALNVIEPVILMDFHLKPMLALLPALLNPRLLEEHVCGIVHVATVPS